MQQTEPVSEEQLHSYLYGPLPSV